MEEETGENNRILKKLTQWAFSRPGMLALAGALVVIIALAIGLNVGGLWERLFGRIGVPRIESIAVLPLTTSSQDPAQIYFAQGVTNTLTLDLQRIGSFRVIADTSMTRYRNAPKPLAEIARELNVDAVAEGTVPRSGDRIRLSANLIHAPTSRRLWGQTYERGLSDVMSLQGEISRAIASEIRAELTPQQQTRLTSRRPVNPEAYEAYLRAYADPGKAEEYLKQAMQLDPGFAPPYDYLSSVYQMRNMFPTLAPRDTYPKAKETAQRALSLDPNLASPHRVLAGVAFEYDWNFVEAEKEFKRALEIAPYGPVAHHLLRPLPAVHGADGKAKGGEPARHRSRSDESGPVGLLKLARDCCTRLRRSREALLAVVEHGGSRPACAPHPELVLRTATPLRRSYPGVSEGRRGLERRGLPHSGYRPCLRNRG